MNKGFEVTLNNAVSDVEYTRDFLEQLETETETRKLWRAWSGLVENYVKAVGAMRHAAAGGSSKKWSDNLLSTQRSDVMLQYAYQARNAHAHAHERYRDVRARAATIPGIVEIQGSVGNFVFEGNTITSGEGENVPIPDVSATIFDGRVVAGIGATDIFVETDHFVRLAPIHSKRDNKTYDVPNTDVEEDRRAIELGRYICDWLSDRLSELQALAEVERKSN